jgi:TonB-dependent SusC/RagA subfamily outer membrane receptor
MIGMYPSAVKTMCTLVLAAAVLAGPLAAQQTGTLTGIVTNTGTMRPISGVQIQIEGTGAGTLTDASGRFLLLNVPVGEVTVVVEMIGFARETRTANVTAGTTTTLDINISERAIALDEIVITGAAAATEKRTLGNSITSVNAAQAVERMPIVSVDQLIMGRAAGVSVNLSGGGGAFGGQVRIRGMTSVALPGDPMIYVDGIRVDGDFDGAGIGIGGQRLSRILDLQAADIERMEIVKGAAAASLYGTQGSNGVIQIFTKRGRTGAPQWTFEIEQGLERVPTDTFPGRLFSRFVGPSGFRARDPLETVETGSHARGLVSVSGGSQDTKYYLSGGYRQQEGSIASTTNWMKQFSGRVNVSTLLGENVTATATSSLIYTWLRVPDNDNALHGTYSQFASAVPYTATEDRPYGERFGSFTANQTVENLQNVLRNTTGITVEHVLSDALSHKLSTGIDWYTDEFTKYFPFAYEGSGNKLGNKTNQTRSFRNITADYRLQLSNNFGSQVSSSFVVGTQADFRNTIRLRGSGSDFPAPGVRSVSATATRTATESRTEEVNAGVFFQETVGLFDKLFLTGGLRVDGNSAFGNEFTSQTYPKASVAYNISEESFWPAGLIPTMKLRVAYGESGLAPAQFAADRTYEPVSSQDGQPAVTPGNIGNAGLGPEKSREIEVGFDAGVLQDRVGIEFTAYFQRTNDALLSVPFAPSLGFLSNQLTNIGEIQNRGIEVGVNALLVQRQDLELTSIAQFSASENEVTDLGGVPPFGVSGSRVAEGYPVMGQWGYTVKEWNPVTRQHIRSDTMVFKGQADPKWYGSISSDLRYKRFRFSGLVEFTGGQVVANFDRYWSARVRTGDDYLSLLEDERGTATPAADSLYNYANTLGSGAYIEPAGYTSLRELAVAYELPDALLGRFGFLRSSIRLSARNLMLWSEYSGMSPETKRRDGNFENNSSFDTQPVPRVLMLTFRTSR